MAEILWQQNNYRIVEKQLGKTKAICHNCGHKQQKHVENKCHHGDCKCSVFLAVTSVCIVEQLFTDAMGEKSWRSIAQFDRSSRGVRLPAAVFFNMMEKHVEKDKEQLP